LRDISRGSAQSDEKEAAQAPPLSYLMMPTQRGLRWLAISAGLTLLAYVLAATTTPTGAAADDASRELRVCGV